MTFPVDITTYTYIRVCAYIRVLSNQQYDSVYIAFDNRTVRADIFEITPAADGSMPNAASCKLANVLRVIFVPPPSRSIYLTRYYYLLHAADGHGARRGGRQTRPVETAAAKRVPRMYRGRNVCVRAVMCTTCVNRSTV